MKRSISARTFCEPKPRIKPGSTRLHQFCSTEEAQPKRRTTGSDYDAAIIRTGQAGPSLANRLTKAGMRRAVLERGRCGGTCVNNGGMQTKTLVASAYVAHLVAWADDDGVVIEG